MNKRISYWVALIVTIWMSETMTKSKGVRPMHNQLSQFEEVGTKWGFLVAGSTGYSNYRHQADVCHAYQVLKSGGLKDENIIVMMYDDIAYNEENPWPGFISNKPDGPNVYLGVPKVSISISSWNGSFAAFARCNRQQSSKEKIFSFCLLHLPAAGSRSVSSY